MATKSKTKLSNRQDKKVTQIEMNFLSLDQSTVLLDTSNKNDKRVFYSIVLSFIILLILSATLLFINKDYLLTLIPQKNTIAIVIKDNSILREGNGIEFPALLKLHKSQMLIVIDSTDYSWVKVKIDKDHTGWVDRSTIVF